ncbi:hypothetical protein [Polynucleobacter yangtzensis]|uniref:hypothetical protein n=1 Tax=Polynucleobacter yangtzensis TaxID=1743159 RepID=UPI00249065E4|nr:hypothetical protein [Polynucleobacter yangtzensis]
MPCILKQPTSESPGIITFTHGEALWGLPKRSKRVKNFLLEAKRSGKWIFGIHIQGDCSYLEKWPMPEWQSFVMWPNQQAKFLHNLPSDQFCKYTCVNFLPKFLAIKPVEFKEWDICVISRASSIKRIEETLLLLRALLDRRPETKIVCIVPDSRHLHLGNKSYAKQSIDKSYFELPRNLFSARELKNISFISSSQDAFGNFPLADSLVADILIKSKFMMLTSHSEGVPRVIAETLLLGTPCIVSENLSSGLNESLNKENSLKIVDDPLGAALQLNLALENYEKFSVNRHQAMSLFSEAEHLNAFKKFLSDKLIAMGSKDQGNWYLEDLHLRLACHGQKQQSQFFYNEKIFFKWLERASALQGTYADEDFLTNLDGLKDSPNARQKLRSYLGTIRRWLKNNLKALYAKY